MQNNLFNSTFEVELRILCLLGSGRKPVMSLERIVFMDFIVCYAESFQMPYKNLHGDNGQMYGELSNRRQLCDEAVRSLVVQGLIDVTVDNGYLYSISATGKKYVRKLQSEYAKLYQEIAELAIKRYKKYPDNELSLIIQESELGYFREVR